MSKADVVRCEAVITALRKQLDDRRKPPADFPLPGCGDNSCEIRSPQGMATNGGCHCAPRDFRLALRWWKRRAEFLEETIRAVHTYGGEGGST